MDAEFVRKILEFFVSVPWWVWVLVFIAINIRRRKVKVESSAE